MRVTVLHWKLSDEQKETRRKYFAGELNTEENENATAIRIPTYDIGVDDKTVTIEFSEEFHNEMRQCKAVIDIAEKEKVYDVFIAETNLFEAIVLPAFAICDRRDGYNTNGADRKKVARVVVDNVGDIYIVLINACEDIEGFDNVTMVFGEHPATWYLRQECLWLESLMQKGKKKIALIRNVDSNRSLGYLEAQVDALTKVVLQLADAKGLDGYELLEAAAQYSVLNIKPSDDVLKEFSENKRKMRKAQEEYYENLHG
jgi:uncharacterized protein YeaO (DUF488 family)